jgi:glyoxylase-like metal-dependent hydrolase (beta-lactamase superfamily II)
MGLSRRTLLMAPALLAATVLPPTPLLGASPGFHRFRLGAFELTALDDGVWHRPMGNDFVRNAQGAALRRAVAKARSRRPDTLPLAITALLVDTGTKLVLIDTGSAGQVVDTAGSLMRHLAAAGVAPEKIDIVLISHFHPDHIDGLKTKDGARVFANAEIKVPATEWAFWMDEALPGSAKPAIARYARNARRIFGDLAKDVTQFMPRQEVAPGIVALDAAGHTPGHTAFAIASGSESMLVLGDVASHPALFVRHPAWQPGWDMDGATAVASRLKLLDRAAADRVPVQAYHFPFPSRGQITRDPRGGYEFVPAP